MREYLQGHPGRRYGRADLVQWTPTGDGGQALLDAPIDFSTLSEQTGQIAYASGATADGFMITGVANDAGTEDTFEQPGDYVEPEEPEEPTDPDEPEQPIVPEKPADQKDPASPGELPSTGDSADAYMAAVAVAGAVALGVAAVSGRKRVSS